jgi:hypothetical protein
MRKIQESRKRLQRNTGEKLQAASSDPHRSIKSQAPKSGFTDPVLRFRIWSFSGAWCLAFGALLTVFVSLAVCAPAPAQTNSFVMSSNRYLLVLEISRSMDSRADGTLRTIQQLLLSGMGGQMKTGDSLGIWTYNNELHAGQFPLQYWSPKTQRSTVENALAFLQAQKCSKTGNFNLVLPALQNLVKSSPVLTVILVSDGEEKIHGTGFDEQINKLHDQWRAEQAKAKMPLITILRASSGGWTNFSVNAAPWPVEMPPMPKLPEVVVKPPAPKPPPPRGPNLIVSGKQIAEQKAARAASNNIQGTATTPLATLTNAQGNQIIQAAPVPSQPILKETSPPPVASPNPPTAVAQLAPAIAPSIAQPSTIKPGPSVGSEPAPTVPAPLIQSAPVKSGAELAASKIPVTESPAVKPVTNLSGNAAPQNLVPRPKTDAERVLNQEANGSAASVGVVQNSGSNTMIVVGLSIVIIAAAILFIWAIRARSARQASLITRSLNQK